MQLLQQPNLESLFQQRRGDIQDLDVQDLDDQAGREEIILVVAMMQAS